MGRSAPRRLIGELTPNATTPTFIKIKTLLRADTPVGQIVISAAVASTDTPETDPPDNTDQVSTSVVTVADVSVDKMTPFETYEPSSQIIYTVNVTNLGPSDAQNVELINLRSGLQNLDSALSASSG